MKNNKKSGVSLIILITMIVIALVLLTLSVIAVGSTVQNSSISAFGNDLKEVEDACGARYIENGLSSFDVIDKNYILKLVGDKNKEEFKKELELNGDNLEKQFLIVDLEKIGVNKSTRGNYKNGENDVYVLTPDTLHAYYLKGITVKGTTYFSITSKVKELL